MSLFPHLQFLTYAWWCASSSSLPTRSQSAPDPPLAAAVWAYFGLPLWALAGHKGSAELEGQVQALEGPLLLAVRLPLLPMHRPLGSTSIEFHCTATSASFPVRTRTADLSIAPGGSIVARYSGMRMPLSRSLPGSHPPLPGCVDAWWGGPLGCRRRRMWGTQRGSGARSGVGRDRPPDCCLW